MQAIAHAEQNVGYSAGVNIFNSRVGESGRPRRAHNSEIAGSNPASATISIQGLTSGRRRESHKLVGEILTQVRILPPEPLLGP